MKEDVEEIVKIADQKNLPNLPSVSETSSEHKLHLETHLAEDVTAEIIKGSCRRSCVVPKIGF